MAAGWITQAEKALTELLNANLEECPVHLVLAAVAQEADLVPIFAKVQVTKRVGEEFRKIVTAKLKALRRKHENGDFRLQSHDAGSLVGPEELECLKLVDEPEVANQLASLSSLNDLPVFDAGGNFVSQLRFYMLQVEVKAQKLLRCFRLYGPKQELTRSSVFGLRISGSTFDKIEEPIFLFDSIVDCLAYDGVLFILNKDKFQKIFRFFALVREAGRQALKKVSEVVKLENYNAFARICEGNLYMLAKLRNIAGKDYLATVTMKDIKRVIKEFNLSVQVVKRDGEEKLLFDESARERWTILNLLDDAYLGSSMTKRKYEANSKREVST